MQDVTERQKTEIGEVVMPTILLPMDASTQLEQLLPVALMLARNRHAGLLALFIEDSRIVQGAALPFTQEISAVSAVFHPVTADSIERRMQCVAQQMQRRLATAAESLRLSWEFRVCRSSIAQVMLETNAEIVLQGWNWMASYPRMQTTRKRHAARRQTNIVVIDDGSESAGQAVNLARKLADSDRHQLVALSISSTEAQSTPTLAAFSSITAFPAPAARRSSSSIFRRTDIASPIVISVTSMQQLAWYLHSLRPTLLMLSQQQTILSDPRMRRELAAIGCPVAILRSGIQ